MLDERAVIVLQGALDPGVGIHVRTLGLVRLAGPHGVEPGEVAADVVVEIADAVLPAELDLDTGPAVFGVGLDPGHRDTDDLIEIGFTGGGHEVAVGLVEEVVERAVEAAAQRGEIKAEIRLRGGVPGQVRGRKGALGKAGHEIAVEDVGRIVQVVRGQVGETSRAGVKARLAVGGAELERVEDVLLHQRTHPGLGADDPAGGAAEEGAPALAGREVVGAVDADRALGVVPAGVVIFELADPGLAAQFGLGAAVGHAAGGTDLDLVDVKVVVFPAQPVVHAPLIVLFVARERVHAVPAEGLAVLDEDLLGVTVTRSVRRVEHRFRAGAGRFGIPGVHGSIFPPLLGHIAVVAVVGGCPDAQALHPGKAPDEFAAAVDDGVGVVGITRVGGGFGHGVVAHVIREAELVDAIAQRGQVVDV